MSTRIIGNVGKGGAKVAVVNIGGVPTTVLKFSVAENYRYGDKEYTQWYNVTNFNYHGKIHEYMTEGRLVEIEGRVKAGKPYTNKEGKLVAGLEMTNAKITLLSANVPAKSTAEEPAEEDEEDTPFCE